VFGLLITVLKQWFSISVKLQPDKFFFLYLAAARRLRNTVLKSHILRSKKDIKAAIVLLAVAAKEVLYGDDPLSSVSMGSHPQCPCELLLTSSNFTQNKPTLNGFHMNKPCNSRILKYYTDEAESKCFLRSLKPML
jgi:hypothetical protein